MKTAFEAITTRQSWHAAEKVTMYEAVMFNEDGKYVKADGTGQFVGIVQYGAERVDDMVTAVRGTFPALCSENITAGAKVTIDSTNPGQFKAAGEADPVYGVALTEAIKDNLFTLAIADIPVVNG